MEHRCRKWLVTIRRWDVYEVEVEASTGADAEDRALEVYDDGGSDCAQIDGGVDSVHAEELEAE